MASSSSDENLTVRLGAIPLHASSEIGLPISQARNTEVAEACKSAEKIFKKTSQPFENGSPKKSSSNRDEAKKRITIALWDALVICAENFTSNQNTREAVKELIDDYYAVLEKIVGTGLELKKIDFAVALKFFKNKKNHPAFNTIRAMLLYVDTLNSTNKGWLRQGNSLSKLLISSPDFWKSNLKKSQLIKRIKEIFKISFCSEKVRETCVNILLDNAENARRMAEERGKVVGEKSKESSVEEGLLFSFERILFIDEHKKSLEAILALPIAMLNLQNEAHLRILPKESLAALKAVDPKIEKKLKPNILAIFKELEQTAPPGEKPILNDEDFNPLVQRILPIFYPALASAVLDDDSESDDSDIDTLDEVPLTPKASPKTPKPSSTFTPHGIIDRLRSYSTSAITVMSAPLESDSAENLTTHSDPIPVDRTRTQSIFSIFDQFSRPSPRTSTLDSEKDSPSSSAPIKLTPTLEEITEQEIKQLGFCDAKTPNDKSSSSLIDTVHSSISDIRSFVTNSFSDKLSSKDSTDFTTSSSSSSSPAPSADIDSNFETDYEEESGNSTEFTYSEIALKPASLTYEQVQLYLLAEIFSNDPTLEVSEKSKEKEKEEEGSAESISSVSDAAREILSTYKEKNLPSVKASAVLKQQPLPSRYIDPDGYQVTLVAATATNPAKTVFSKKDDRGKCVSTAFIDAGGNTEVKISSANVLNAEETAKATTHAATKLKGASGRNDVVFELKNYERRWFDFGANRLKYEAEACVEMLKEGIIPVFQRHESTNPKTAVWETFKDLHKSVVNKYTEERVHALYLDELFKAENTSLKNELIAAMMREMGTAGKITYKNIAYTADELQTHPDEKTVKEIIYAQFTSKENSFLTKKYFSQHAEVALFRPRPQRNLAATHSDRNSFRLE